MIAACKSSQSQQQGDSYDIDTIELYESEDELKEDENSFFLEEDS